MKLLTIIFFLCGFTIMSSSVNASTAISINGSLFSFESPPRLVDVLAPVALKEDWYWPASRLYRLGNKELNTTRHEVIGKLEEMLRNDSLGPKQQSTVAVLINHILQWKLAEHIPIIIDYDFARTKVSLNPLFDDGEYLIKLLKRPGKVHIFGASFSDNTQAHRGAADISEYLAGLSLPSHVDNDYVYIIQADGRTQRVPYAYWNKGHQEIMPGSQIYLPFKTQFFSSENKKLNEQIVFLAANRILP